MMKWRMGVAIAIASTVKKSNIIGSISISICHTRKITRTGTGTANLYLHVHVPTTI